MAALEQIQARLQKLQAQADAIVAKQSSAILETIRGLMEQHGLTTADIDAHLGRKKRGPKAGSKAAAKSAQSVPKYRDPKSGATWSGHGRAPGWIANVKDRSKFLVDSGGTSAVLAPAEKAKAAGNYVRGPQPAKYRDPKSGATWSGRGRAPDWMASARDRTRYLIDGSTEVASEAGGVRKARKPKAAAKSGVVAKKFVANKAAAAKSLAAKKVASNKASAVKTSATKVEALTMPNATIGVSA
jgi:DNA-binding protein H-NS